ncbi:MAG: iron-sulfur cluster assembly scaffold protein [Planctomycetota bacterium]
MEDALRKLMLAAEGAGELQGEDVQRGRAEHPVCGDVLELSWREDSGAITELAWRAKGCPATLAAAAAAHAILPGKPRARAEQELRDHIRSLGGLKPHEEHSQRMVLRALGL